MAKKLTATILPAILVGLLLRYLLAPPVYRIAMVLPADPDQSGWSSYVLASAGVIERRLEMQEGVKARIDYTTAVTNSAEALHLFAAQGYDFVIAADDSYETQAREAAKRFPTTAFALLGNGLGNGENLGVIALRHAELGQAAGQVMALKTQTGSVAYLAGDKTPRREQALHGLEQAIGEQSGLQVHWQIDDPAEAADLAVRLFDREGVDVICVDADIDTMMAVYETARQRPGAYVSNWHIDLSSLYPDQTLGSYNAAPADVLAEAVVTAYQGKWAGRRYSYGAGDNVFNVTPLHNLDETQQELVWNNWTEIYDREFAR